MKIRLMTSDDIPAVFKIDQESAALYWPESSYHFEVEKNPSSRPWVAVNTANEPLGFLMLWLIVDEIHIANFAVAPCFRQQGIGRALLEYGLKKAWEEGARVSFLEVRASNKAAISLYRKLGFEVVNIRKNYYQDNHEDALLMNLETPDYQAYIRTLEEK